MDLVPGVPLDPAGVLGGVRALKAIAGPFSDVRYIPSEGVNAHNLAGYLRFPCGAARSRV
jgi:2-dehydro-3-deoxyphosphogluconate aldolase/(4S)-4-hydroxy-2-oxoglutarate aldolase